MRRLGYVLFWLALVLMAWASNTYGQVSPEVGVGFAHATARHDGTWYQKAFPYRLHLNKPSYLVGLRYDADPWTTHFDVVWFGRTASDALAVTEDANYDPMTQSCNGPCLPLAHYHGQGWAGAIKLTFGWHTQGPWPLNFQLGPMAVKEAWAIRVPDWYSAHQQADGTWVIDQRADIRTNQQQWMISWTAGIALEHGSTSIALDWNHDAKSFPGHAGVWPPGWKWVTTLSIVHHFKLRRAQ